MLHIDLFTGIGGFSIASERMGWKTVLTCEIDKFCNKVLQYHLPDAYHHTDIKTLNYATINDELSRRYGSSWRSDDIIVTGGFPCQPYSLSGKRKGTADDRYLWPEMLRVIREILPEYVVAENVLGLLSQERGMVFERVCADLEAIGYEVQPVIIPACAVNAPHRRDRIWFIANRADTGTESLQRKRKDGICESKDAPDADVFDGNISGFHTGEISQLTTPGIFKNSTSDAASIRLQRRLTQQNTGNGKRESGRLCRKYSIQNWDDFPTVPPVCGGDDEISAQLDGITFSRLRRESIKAYGNAVVVQVVYQIFKAIEQTENILKTK